MRNPYINPGYQEDLCRTGIVSLEDFPRLAEAGEVLFKGRDLEVRRRPLHDYYIYVKKNIYRLFPLDLKKS
jgi:hypothetical protein